ncbi:MAG TPA: hypothetical protein VKA67_04385, partial [Verrucomicrobiae bacterium]|nr:hypothetical protein [Verrucomicrobiae bacterium]
GKHDNALANLRRAAVAGRKHGAIGYLITDWGDGGHPQPLAVSYLPFLAGAALSWCAKSFDEKLLVPVLERDVFYDSAGRLANTAFALGLTHRKLGVVAPNETPLGTVIAAPPPKQQELFCRNGLKWFAKIPPEKIRTTLQEIAKLIVVLRRQARDCGGLPPLLNNEEPLNAAEDCRSPQHSRAFSQNASKRILILELNLAGRMAAQSCHYMLWQQALAKRKTKTAQQLAREGIRELQSLERDFKAYWPKRNKGTTAKCSPFLRWRIEDYRKSLC